MNLNIAPAVAPAFAAAAAAVGDDFNDSSDWEVLIWMTMDALLCD